MEIPIDKLRKFNPHVESKMPGIFKTTKRQQLIGRKRIYERKEGEDERYIKNTFWYRTRNQVRTSLIDLELFIETAGKDNVNQVVTAENLEPIVNALLLHPILDEEKPDRRRAEIARLFISKGFKYLRSKGGTHLGFYERIVDDALEATDYLVANFKGE
jgi:hypothetical protein